MKKLTVVMLVLALACGLVPCLNAAAEESAPQEQLAYYSQDFSDLESVQNDFSAYSVYDLGTDSESDMIDENADGSGYWYLNQDTDGSYQITRKNLEDGKELDGANGTRYIRILTFTRQKFVNFELEVDFKRGKSTAYWAGIAIRQLNQGKYFLEDGAGIFCQQEGTTTLWGSDGVGGPYEADPIPKFSPNAYHHMKVVCNGLTLEIYVDGSLTMSRTLPRSFFRQGYVSLVSVNNDSSYKNFSIKELPIERLPEEEGQQPIPEADSEDSLSNLSKLPAAERFPVEHNAKEGDNNAAVWTVMAIVTGCTAVLAIAWATIVFVIRKKHKDAKGGASDEK